MAAHTDCFQIKTTLTVLLTIFPTREDILSRWIWVWCKTHLDNMGCRNFLSVP